MTNILENLPLSSWNHPLVSDLTRETLKSIVLVSYTPFRRVTENILSPVVRPKYYVLQILEIFFKM